MKSEYKVLQQPNVITQARFSFSEYEMRVLLFVVRHIQVLQNKNGLEFNQDLFGEEKDFRIHFKLSELMLTDQEKHHDRIRKAFKDLRLRDFEVENEKVWFNVGFINYSVYRKDIKCYELQVSHLLMPYLLSMAKGYTEFQLNVVLRLNSHAQRLYLMASRFCDKEFFVIKASDLRYQLGLESKYNNYSGFKKWVLKKSEVELKALFDDSKADLYFSLVEDKKNRKSEDEFDRTLKFKIMGNDDKLKAQQDLKAHYYRAIHDLLRRFFPDKDSYIAKVMNALDKNRKLVVFYERAVAIETEALEQGSPLHLKGGLVRHILTNDYQIQ